VLYDQQDAWEEDGATRREFLEVTANLQDVLGCTPWHEHMLSTLEQDQPPAYMAGDAEKLADYKRAVANEQ
jgi:hypothetical protein